MRFRFSKPKSEKLQKNPKRGIGFEDAQEIFAHPYYLDKRSGEYYHLVTLWRATREEKQLYEANE